MTIALALTVAEFRWQTPTIAGLSLVRSDRAPLPAFTPGAHITLSVAGVGLRKYSLVALTGAELTTPQAYQIAVRLDPTGGGGSRAVCALKPGDRVDATGPSNNFPLKAGDGPVALVAGGIGVTPLLSMAVALSEAGRAFRFIYAVRSGADVAFGPALEALAGDRLLRHADDLAGGPINLSATFAALESGTQVYMCGPKPMLKAGIDAGRRLGWPRDRIAFELFYSVATGDAQAS